MKISLKKISIGIFSAIPFTLFLTPLAYASPIDICPQGSPFNGVCSGTATSIIGPVINVVFVVAILIALAFLIYGGLRWILSQGDKVKVAGARDMLVAALIGLIVVFLSYFLLNLVITLLFGDSVQNVLNNVTTKGIFNQ